MEVDDDEQPGRAYCSLCYEDDRTDYVILHGPGQATVNTAHYCCWQCAETWIAQRDTCPDCRRRIRIEDLVRMPPLHRCVCSTVLIVRDNGRADVRDDATGLGYRWCNGARMRDSNYCRHHAAPEPSERDELQPQHMQEERPSLDVPQMPLVVDADYHRQLRRVLESTHTHREARQQFLDAGSRFVMVNEAATAQLIEHANTLNLRSDAQQFELQDGGQLQAAVLPPASRGNDDPVQPHRRARLLSEQDRRGVLSEQLATLGLD